MFGGSPAVMNSIFTEKTVGLAFAAAFALWAWMLNAIASDVKEGIQQARTEQMALKAEVVQLRAEVIAQQLRVTADVTEIRSRQVDVLRRLDFLESPNGKSSQAR